MNSAPPIWSVCKVSSKFLNLTFFSCALDENDKKKVLYYYLNKYLDNIINDHLDYLIEKTQSKLLQETW